MKIKHLELKSFLWKQESRGRVWGNFIVIREEGTQAYIITSLDSVSGHGMTKEGYEMIKRAGRNDKREECKTKIY